MKKIIYLFPLIIGTALLAEDKPDSAYILERTKEFAQTQKMILPKYMASVSATLLMNEAVIKGEGILCFEPPDIYKEEIGDITCSVEGIEPEKLKELLKSPSISPFEIYEIFKEKDDYDFKYIKEENNLYLFRITPKKGCKEPLEGQIGIDKTEFAIVFADVDFGSINLGLFSVKVKIKASFNKVGDRYWLPYELVENSTIRVLWKKMKMVTTRMYSNFKVNEDGRE
jgi:hypothetical protein